jgi:hypothetical protein
VAAASAPGPRTPAPAPAAPGPEAAAARATPEPLTQPTAAPPLPPAPWGGPPQIKLQAPPKTPPKRIVGRCWMADVSGSMRRLYDCD